MWIYHELKPTVYLWTNDQPTKIGNVFQQVDHLIIEFDANIYVYGGVHGTQSGNNWNEVDKFHYYHESLRAYELLEIMSDLAYQRREIGFKVNTINMMDDPWKLVRRKMLRTSGHQIIAYFCSENDNMIKTNIFSMRCSYIDIISLIFKAMECALVIPIQIFSKNERRLRV